MATPAKKLVHWGQDVSISDLGSPFMDSSSDSIISTSSLQYINSQLVAHGFASSPLSLDGLSNSDSERVIKCLFGMLGQRIDDVSRTEDLTAKYRTLSYDYERLMSMHCSTVDQAANAEREMNLHKSKLATVNRTLQSVENAHKQTAAELQRMKTSLQGVRATHQSELRKKEKEIERMVEKWSKLADAQVKLAVTPSGIRCANAGIVEGLEIVKGKGYLEVALDEAESSRSRLAEDNSNFRRIILSAVNETQSILFLTQRSSSVNLEEPTPLTLSTLFPLSPDSFAKDKLLNLLSSLRESLKTLSHGVSSPTSSLHNGGSSVINEVGQLKAVVDTLRAELEQSHKQSAAQATEAQALFDRYSEDHRMIGGDVGEMSVDFMTEPAVDEERCRLDAIRKELDEERRKFTEAAIRLGKERAALEAERIKLLDEKRMWQVEMMLAELPATPAPDAPSPPLYKKPAIHESPRRSPRKSPRKSPVKSTAIPVGKGASSRKTRVSRRRSSGLGLSSQTKVQPAFETEVIPPIAAPLFRGTESFLPNSFVLPPPSPSASLPPQRAILTNTTIPSSHEPAPAPLAVIQPPPAPEAGPSSNILNISPPNSTDNLASIAPPQTPRRAFPVAKPFATRMVHAYSPVKPSPLSRILMLADSPTSPNHTDATPLDVLLEEEESEGIRPQSLTLEMKMRVDGEDGSPLREKVESNASSNATVNAKSKSKAHASRKPDTRRLITQEKGKSKADPVVPVKRINGGTLEKENDAKRVKALTGVGAKSSVSSSESRKVVGRPKPVVNAPAARGRPLAPGRGGARRVPIDSAEATLGPGWRK